MAAIQPNGLVIQPNAPRPARPAWSQTSTAGKKWRWEQTREPCPSGHAIDMSFHHVIGWKLIHGVWNKLVGWGEWAGISQWAYLLHISDDDVAAMQANNYNDAQAVIQLCWSPWTMVEGPQGNIRTDDPGQDGEYDSFKFGGSHSARTHIQNLAILYTAMLTVSKATLGTDPSIAALRKTMKDLQSIRGREHIAFEESMWEVVEKGKYNPKFPAAPAIRVATWKKASK